MRAAQHAHLLLVQLLIAIAAAAGPVVISTWFPDAVQAAYDVAAARMPALDAVDAGVTFCEVHQCDGTVGWGSHPDTTGEVTLDAIVMDGATLNTGSVGYLRGIRTAFAAARKVMAYSQHTLLAGDGATNFSVLLGLTRESLESNATETGHAAWVAGGCQPNYWANFLGVNTSCVNATCIGDTCAPIPTAVPTPYPPSTPTTGRVRAWMPGGVDGTGPKAPNSHISRTNHDTIGMCVLDVAGNLVGGGSSNGAGNKVAGRIGDVPVPGAGVYADNEAGCAGATGDGDLTMRFLPAYQAVEFMRGGMAPQAACEAAVRRIMRVYNTSAHIGLVCMDRYGAIGAAAQAWTFTYAYANEVTGGKSVVVSVPPLPPLPPA